MVSMVELISHCQVFVEYESSNISSDQDGESYEDNRQNKVSRKSKGISKKDKNKNSKKLGGKKRTDASKFFDVEADEGADSDENHNNKGNITIKEAYYRPEDLRKKNKGLNDEVLNRMEESYKLKEERKQAKLSRQQHRRESNDVIEDEESDSDEEPDLDDDVDQRSLGD